MEYGRNHMYILLKLFVMMIILWNELDVYLLLIVARKRVMMLLKKLFMNVKHINEIFILNMHTDLIQLQMN